MLIETENSTTSFGSKPALADVSVTIDEGQIVAVLGPNGAGKTTLLRGHLPWLEAISLGFKPLLIFVAAHQFWMQFLIPIDPKSDRVLADTRQGFDLLFCIAFIIGTVSVFVVNFDSIWSLLATGILFGASWLHRRYSRWMILKRHTDLVALPADVETTPGMTQ